MIIIFHAVCGTERINTPVFACQAARGNNWPYKRVIMRVINLTVPAVLDGRWQKVALFHPKMKAVLPA